MPTSGTSTYYIFSDVRRRDSILKYENIYCVDGPSVVTAVLKHNGDEWP